MVIIFRRRLDSPLSIEIFSWKLIHYNCVKSFVTFVIFFKKGKLTSKIVLYLRRWKHQMFTNVRISFLVRFISRWNGSDSKANIRENWVCSKTFVAYLQIVTVFLRESFVPTFKNFQQHSRVIQTLTNHECFTNFVFLR